MLIGHQPLSQTGVDASRRCDLWSASPLGDHGTFDFDSGEVDGRYWTGFDRDVPVEAAAREMAWSGTAHALVAELGVGAATHSTLQLALGVAALLAGLGFVSTVMGAAFIWETRRRNSVFTSNEGHP